MPFREAVVRSAAVRAQPIVLTGVAALIGAFFILDDPIFNGLAASLIFGILVSTLLTLVVIPVPYYAVFRRDDQVSISSPPRRSPMTVDRYIRVIDGLFVLVSLALGVTEHAPSAVAQASAGR